MENFLPDKLPNFQLAEAQKYELTANDRRWARIYALAPFWSSVLISIPLPILFFILFVLATATATKAMFFFLIFISGGVMFAIGLMIGLMIFLYGRQWRADLREKLAADGIKTNEVDWFLHELTTAERRSLKELERSNRLLADAYRETLASRLTAARILKTTKQELQLVQRRQNKIKYLKKANTEELETELKSDAERLEKVKNEAKELRDEAETRLQMIEAAARRGTQLADTETALKRLSARSAELPMALESARMEDEARQELEKDGIP
jgi:hypothetical protein